MTDRPGDVAPAGWYVDPTTSLHLRWWSGLAWTDQVAPIPEVAAAPDAYLVDTPEFPWSSAAPVEAALVAPAPIDAATRVNVPAEISPAVSELVETENVQAEDVRDDDLQVALPPPPVPRIAPVSSYEWGRKEGKESAPLRTLPVGYGPAYTAIPGRWSSVSVWVIAFTPWICIADFVAFFVFGLIYVSAEPLNWVPWAGLALPSLITLAAALVDVRRLRTWGHQKVASWAWALLGAPAYLIARTVVLRRNTGIGSAPLWIWLANFLILVGLIVLAIVLFVVLLGQYNDGVSRI